MRITLVSESFFPAVDATTTTVKAVADRAIDVGHQVSVIAPGPGLATYRGGVVRRIDPLSPSAPKPGAQVRDALVDLAPDVVLVVGPGALATVGRKALKHAERLGVRRVVVQTTPVPDLQWEQWTSKVAARADRVLVTASWLGEELGRRGVATDLWLPGVDPAAFSPALRDPWLHDSWARSRSSGGALVVVGFVGGLHKRHGVRRLAALADVPGTRLVVVGAGPQRRWLEGRLPRARFAGELAGGDLATAVASMDLLVHPGTRETCCHALREAAASGVPVVAPRAGGARAVVRHLETGLLHDPDDPRDLVRAVESLVADRHRGLMGTHAREVAVARTWRDAVDELLLEHLRDLAAEDAAEETAGAR